MGDSSASFDSPYRHSNQASQFESNGDMRNAEAEYKSAIKAADSLPLKQYRDDYKSRRAHETALHHASNEDFGEGALVGSLEELERSYQELLALPFLTRLQLAGFYSRHNAVPEAKEAYEEAIAVGLDEVSAVNPQLKSMEQRAKDLCIRLRDIIGPSDPSNIFEKHFSQLDANRDGFVNQSELKQAQLDLSLDEEAQKLIQFLLYHYFDVQKASIDEFWTECSGITKRDVREFQKQSQADWKRMKHKK